MREIIIHKYDDETVKKIEEHDKMIKNSPCIFGETFTRFTDGAVLGRTTTISTGDSGIEKSDFLITAAVDLLKANKKVLYITGDDYYGNLFKWFHRNPYYNSKMDLSVINVDDITVTAEEIKEIILEEGADYVIYDYLGCIEGKVDFEAYVYQSALLQRIALDYNKFIFSAVNYVTDDEFYQIACRIDNGFTASRDSNNVILQPIKLKHNKRYLLDECIYGQLSRKDFNFKEMC